MLARFACPAAESGSGQLTSLSFIAALPVPYNNGRDDCWEWTSRDAKGDIQWDASRFPNGLPAMVAQLHALNFSVGIYTSLGYQTCAKAGHNSTMPGSYGSYAQDAATFASWQIDAVKGELASWVAPLQCPLGSCEFIIGSWKH